MAAASLPVVVDGVRCRLNFKSSCVTVGTSAAERRLVKPFVFDSDAAQATAAQVEAQVRSRSRCRAVHIGYRFQKVLGMSKPFGCL